MSKIIAFTKLIKSSANITLSEISGNIQRVINTGTVDITVTYGSGTKIIPSGKIFDFWYDGTSWRNIDGQSNIDAQSLNGAGLSSDIHLGNSDALIPTQKAVKTYMDASLITDISNTNLNDLKTSDYYEGNNLTNSPDGTANKFYVEVIQSANTLYTLQRAKTCSQSIFHTYEREQVGGVWNGWRRIPKNDELIGIKANFWILRTSAADNAWMSVCFGNGIFVAVATNGTGNRVMTSPDGINWTIRASAADNNWCSVCYGNGLFIAVANLIGTGNRVMTSPDGINWTIRASAVDNSWNSVCYGNGLFVAVAYSGSGNRVMTSPDGINWTIRSSAADNAWMSVCYGNGLFVAVAQTGNGNRVMTSPDGINWTIRSSAADNEWRSICYGNGLFVTVAYSSTENQVMTSNDGINWTIRESAVNNIWSSVCYGNGLFVAVAINGTGNRVMTSHDGIIWTIRKSAADNSWQSICYGNGLFVAVAYSSTGNRVMTCLI